MVQLVRGVLNGVIVVSVPRFEDNRGSFMVTFEEKAEAQLGLPTHFVQDNLSVSAHVGTIRGIHLQLPPFAQGKLVRVQRGRIVDLVVDLRPSSPSFGQHELIELSAETGHLLWVPPGFGHGFCTLEPATEVSYKVDAAYAPAAERTLAWDDPTVGVAWPVGPDGPVLSDKDARGLSFAEVVDELARAEAGSMVGAPAGGEQV